MTDHSTAILTRMSHLLPELSNDDRLRLDGFLSALTLKCESEQNEKLVTCKNAPTANMEVQREAQSYEAG